MTNGPLTAYSIFLMAGFMLSKVMEGNGADSMVTADVVDSLLANLSLDDRRR